jgi:SAM-dependent methyltransferase
VRRVEYEKLYEVEDRMWWFRGAHANLIAAFRTASDGPALPLLDAGCGTGGLLRRLAGAFPSAPLCGVDLDPYAAALAARKSGAPVCVGSVDRLPFGDGALGGVVSADVLCHGGVDEAGAAREFHRCLAPGGVAVLNLPAYPWLLSAHDRAVDNVRRYTRATVVTLLEGAGFARVRAFYWNALLFPLMVLRRKLLGGGDSDVALLPAPVEALFRAAMRLETALVARGAGFPFGGSVIGVAVK